MGIDISKTPSNCAYKICAFNIFYDVYSIFQLKRKKCNNKIHLSHKVFQACPCTDLPSLARKSILLFKLLFLLCGAGPPLPDSVEIGPGKRPPSRGGTMSLSAWLCSQFPPVWRQQLPHPTHPHGAERQAAFPMVALYPPGKLPRSGVVLLGNRGEKIHLQLLRGVLCYLFGVKTREEQLESELLMFWSEVFRGCWLPL